MINDDYCSGCAHEHDCKTIYEAIGNSRGPGVTAKVLFAFVIPIGIFLLILSTAEAVLSRTGLIEPLRIIIGFLLALAASLLTAWVAGIPQRREKAPPKSCLSKERNHEDNG